MEYHRVRVEEIYMFIKEIQSYPNLKYKKKAEEGQEAKMQNYENRGTVHEPFIVQSMTLFIYEKN